MYHEMHERATPRATYTTLSDLASRTAAAAERAASESPVLADPEWIAANEGWASAAAREAGAARLLDLAREIATEIAAERLATRVRVYCDLWDRVATDRTALPGAEQVRVGPLQVLCLDAARTAVDERNEWMDRVAREQHEAYLEEQEAERARQDVEAELELEAHYAHECAVTQAAA